MAVSLLSSVGYFDESGDRRRSAESSGGGWRSILNDDADRPPKVPSFPGPGPSSHGSQWQDRQDFSGPSSYGRPPPSGPPGAFPYGTSPQNPPSAYAYQGRPRSLLEPLNNGSWRGLAESEGIVFEDEEEEMEQDFYDPRSDFSQRQFFAERADFPLPGLFSERQDFSQRRSLLGGPPMQTRFGSLLGNMNFGRGENGRQAFESLEPPAPKRDTSQRWKPLLDAPSMEERAPDSGSPNLNPQHPAYGEKAEQKYTIDGPDKFREYFDHPFTLYLFDKAYEQSIWDYDPKYTWDYLPGSKRGTKSEIGAFVWREDYTQEENKWKKWEHVLEDHWQKNFVPKVLEQQAKIEAGIELPQPKPKVQTPDDLPQNIILKYFEENIGFPEDSITVEYCGMCDIAFNSVLASINHYQIPKHEKSVKNYFIDALLDHEQVTVEDLEKQWLIDFTRRLIKKFKTKPSDYRCTICDIELSSAAMAKTHFNGMQHQRRAKGLPMVEKVAYSAKQKFQMQCVACNVWFENQREASNHIQSKVHIMNVKACAEHGVTLPPGPSSQIGKTKLAKKNAEKAIQALSGSNMIPLGGGQGGNMVEEELYCTTCNKALYSRRQYDLHLQSTQHMQRETNLARMAMKGKQPMPPAQKKKLPPRQKALTVAGMGTVPMGAVKIAVCKPQESRTTTSQSYTITRTFAVSQTKGPPNARVTAAVQKIQKQQNWVPAVPKQQNWVPAVSSGTFW